MQAHPPLSTTLTSSPNLQFYVQGPLSRFGVGNTLTSFSHSVACVVKPTTPQTQKAIPEKLYPSQSVTQMNLARTNKNTPKKFKVRKKNISN